MSLLKELPLEVGKIKLHGTMCYASQDAWSFNDSVRNNILFDMDYDEARYRKVIDVCALERDIHLMPFGDRTLIGEKGVMLSGGQKARINLARAIYRNADICLLDDPLSAVDTTVAEHILERCILEHLRYKICILVTHQIQFIEKATKILVLNDGQCLAYGSFNKLQQLGIDFMSLLGKGAKEQGQDEQEKVLYNSEQSLDPSASLWNVESTNNVLKSQSIRAVLLSSSMNGAVNEYDHETQEVNFVYFFNF